MSVPPDLLPLKWYRTADRLPDEHQAVIGQWGSEWVDKVKRIGTDWFQVGIDRDQPCAPPTFWCLLPFHDVAGPIRTPWSTGIDGSLRRHVLPGGTGIGWNTQTKGTQT